MRYLTASLFLLATSGTTLASPCGSEEDAASSEYHLHRSAISLGSGLGASGFNVVDSDYDGINELVFGSGTGFGSNTSFVMIEHNSETNSYDFVCQSSALSGAITRISSFQNSSITQGSALALDNHLILIVDHTEGSFVHKINAGIAINDILVADIDNDGAEEIAVLSDVSIHLFNVEDYSLEHSYPVGGKRFATGQFTDTTGVEVAINNGLVIEGDGTNFSTLWDYTSSGFSNYLLEAGDIDNDGLDEIVGADSWYDYRALNADTKNILWQRTSDLDIDALHLADINGDKTPEVLYGDGQWGSIYGIDGSSGTQIWSLKNPDHGVTDIIVAQLNPDAGTELFWGAGYSSTGADYLHSAKAGGAVIEWSTGDDLSGPHHAVAIGDLNGDDVDDYVYASVESESGYGDGILTAIDGDTDQTLWITTPDTFSGRAWTGVHAVLVADTDGDEINEVLVGTDELYNGKVYILSPQDGAVVRSITLEDGSPIYSLQVANIDADPDLEILAGGGKEHTGATGVKVYVIDGSTFAWESTLPSLGNLWQNLWRMDAVDFDGDGQSNIMAILDQLYVIDTTASSLKKSGLSFTSMASLKNSDGPGETAYAANASGDLYAVSADASTSYIRRLCTGVVTSLTSISVKELAFTCKGKLAIYDIQDDVVHWQQTNPVDNTLGVYDRIQHSEINGISTIITGGDRARIFKKGSPSETKPVAFSASFSVHFNAPLQGQLTGKDSNDKPLRFAIYRSPTSGSITAFDNETGNFEYTPAADLATEASFQFVVSNGDRLSAPAAVTLQLTNTPPVATEQTLKTYFRTPLSSKISASDPDGDPLIYELVSATDRGILTLDADGTVSYQPEGPKSYSTTAMYRVSDGREWSKAGILRIDVQGAPSSSSGGGGLPLLSLITLLLLIRRR